MLEAAGDAAGRRQWAAARAALVQAYKQQAARALGLGASAGAVGVKSCSGRRRPASSPAIARSPAVKLVAYARGCGRAALKRKR